MQYMMRFLAVTLLSFVLVFEAQSKGVYLEVDEFIAQSFSEQPEQNQSPEQKLLWVSAEQREIASEILDHKLHALRIRYWQQGQRTAWIFDEIGKERPITIGIVVEGDAISQVRILAFRESRGGEVRYPFFTDQFVGLHLNDKRKLSDHIDGITGATLSVWAVTKVSRLALYFHQQVLPSAAPEK